MLKKALKNDYLFSLFTKVLSVAIGIIYSIVYSRFLGAELRGTAAIITNYSELSSLIITFGAFSAYPFFIKSDGKDRYEEFINNVFALFFLCLIFSGILAYLFKNNINISIAILIAPFWMCNRQLNYIILIENPRRSNAANTSVDIIDLLFVSVLLFVKKSSTFEWCVAIVSAKHILLFIFCLFNIFKKKFRFHPTFRGIMPYIKYGIIPMFTIVLMEINYKMDVLMLEWFKITKADIGVYSLGVMLSQKVLLIPDALKDVLLSKLVSGKNTEEVCKICRISFTITFIIEIVVLLFGKQIIFLFYGEEYANAYLTTVIICAGVIGMVFYKMIYSFNVVIGYKNTNLLILGISAFLNVALNALLIPVIGSNGAAVASLVSYLFCGVSFIVFFCRKTHVSLKDILLIRKTDLLLLKKAIFK